MRLKSMGARRKLLTLLGLGVLCALGSPNAGAADPQLPAASASAPAPAPPVRVSDAQARKTVNITVYNADFALVREVRQLSDLPNGRLALEFRDVASTIQPETVAVRALGSGGLRVLEQNYRYDLLTPETLLNKHVGSAIRVYRYHPQTAKEEGIDAKLLSTAGAPILQIGREITFDYPGRLAFPELPPNLIARPTLVWLLESRAARQEIEVSYLARSMSWSADYVLVLDEKETRAELVGWVTLVNNSGASYTGAKLQLVAGDVHRVEPEMELRRQRGISNIAMSAPAFREEGLLEYHLYTLERPTDVLDREQKQVTLLEAKGVSVEKKLIFEGQPYWFRGQVGEVAKNQKVSVRLHFDNAAQNQLGIPLPKGTVRVYKADRSGNKQFVGEDAIDHTPRDEEIRLEVGQAFDVVADRRQMSWSALGDCRSESTWRIDLKNQKDEDVSVEVREPAGGEWSVVESTHPAVRDHANAFHFDVKVPKRGATQLRYRVRVRWC